jgi:hypothetical protein
MSSGSRRETRRSIRPGLEALDERIVPTVYHAKNVTELVAAVAQVNNSTGPNTIELAAGSYFLTSEIQIKNAGDLTIVGSTKNSGTGLFGGGSDRLFEIDGGSVTLDGLTLTGGGNVIQGGAIHSQNANLTVEASTVAGNKATVMGGGIFVQGGSLTLEKSEVSQNAAGDSINSAFGGGIAAVNAQVTIDGGAVNANSASSTDTNLQDSVVDIGGGIYTQGGTLNIKDSSVSNNRAWGITNGPNAFVTGGAIGTSGTDVSIVNGTIVRNTLTASASQTVFRPGSTFSTIGGSLTITNSVLSRDVLTANQQFYHVDAPVVLKNPTIGGRKHTGTFTLGDNGFTSGQ